MNKVFKALSDPTRRRVLELLKRRAMSAGELASEFDITKPTLSAHLAVLRDAALVSSEKRGRSVIYHLQISVLEDALLAFATAVGLEMSATGQASEPAHPQEDEP